ncbi:down syndrome cell adhesion molecule-like protein Dscam2, partial [Caerostris extrusa]
AKHQNGLSTDNSYVAAKHRSQHGRIMGQTTNVIINPPSIESSARPGCSLQTNHLQHAASWATWAGCPSLQTTNPPSIESQHGRIMGYYVGYRMSQSPDNYVFQQVESNPRTEHQSTYIRGLRPSTHYDIVLKAFNSVGDGPRSSKTSGKTLETDPAPSPAFGKRESSLPFYKNIALVVSILVCSLVVLVLLFAAVVCFKKHSHDQRDEDDYESNKAVGDSLKMSVTSMSLPAKPPKLPHYICPTGKIEYAEPYACNDSAVSKQMEHFCEQRFDIRTGKYRFVAKPNQKSCLPTKTHPKMGRQLNISNYCPSPSLPPKANVSC